MRKLIGFGKSSYVISLPKQWLESNKLTKGDLISVNESKEGLLLKANNTELKKEEPKTIVINAENKSLGLLKTEIVSAYLNNYDVIEVISKDLKTNAHEIRDMLHALSGIEIINQSLTRIVAKDLINISEISTKTLIRRMDNITRSMMKDAVECFDGVDHAESIAHIDEEVNRLFFLTYRIIRSALKDVRIANSLGTNAQQLHSDHTIIKQVERIADNIKRICRDLKTTKLDKKCKNELKEIFKEIKQSYEDIMKSYYTNDRKIALEMERKNKERIVKCSDFFRAHSYKNMDFKNVKKKGVCEFRHSCGSTVKITENMKEMASEIVVIARAVINAD